VISVFSNIVICHWKSSAQEVSAALEATRILWIPLKSLMTEKVETMASGVVDMVDIVHVVEQTTLLRRHDACC